MTLKSRKLSSSYNSATCFTKHFHVISCNTTETLLCQCCISLGFGLLSVCHWSLGNQCLRKMEGRLNTFTYAEVCYSVTVGIFVLPAQHPWISFREASVPHCSVSCLSGMNFTLPYSRVLYGVRPGQ